MVSDARQGQRSLSVRRRVCRAAHGRRELRHRPRRGDERGRADRRQRPAGVRPGAGRRAGRGDVPHEDAEPTLTGVMLRLLGYPGQRARLRTAGRSPGAPTSTGRASRATSWLSTRRSRTTPPRVDPRGPGDRRRPPAAPVARATKNRRHAATPGPPFVVVAMLLWFAWYLSYTAARLDRLHTRVEGALSALDAQLVRRAEATLELANSGALDPASALSWPCGRVASRSRRHNEHLMDDDSLDGPSFGEREPSSSPTSLQALRTALSADGRGGAPGPTTLGCAAAALAGSRPPGCVSSWPDGSTTTRSRDVRRVRRKAVVRLFRLAGHAAMPAHGRVRRRAPPRPRDSHVASPRCWPSRRRPTRGTQPLAIGFPRSAPWPAATLRRSWQLRAVTPVYVLRTP